MTQSAGGPTSLTRTNILRFDTVANTATCTVCGEVFAYQITDEFQQYQVFDGKRTIRIKKRNDAIRGFLELHFGRHRLERKKVAGR